jgi:hypothetical protein
MPSLPLEVLHMIFDLSDTVEKYTISQTNRYFNKLKIIKPYRYYCFWQNCFKNKTKYGKYGAIYKYFFHIEDCLKYCHEIRYDSSNGANEAHYLEIGKVIQAKKFGYITRIPLTTFNLAWDDPCNGRCDSDCNCSDCDSE